MKNTFIQVDIKKAQEALNRLKNSGKNLKPLMLEISETIKYAVDRNFQTEGDGKWQPTGRGGRILQDTGRLKNSIKTFHNNKQAGVGTNLVYAAIHNFGGQTKARVIRPKNKKALTFGGKFYKKVNHPGSKIPARPFFYLNEEAIADIKESIDNYIKTINRKNSKN